MRWWRSEHSMRDRLIVIIALVLITGFIATNAVSYLVSRHSLHQTIVDSELPLISDNIYSEIQADLLRPVFVASLMANDTFLRDWLLHGEHDVASVQRYLDNIREQYGVFTSFVVSERTHRYYHFSGVTQVVNSKDPNDAWYFRVRDMQTPYEINVDYNAAQANAMTIFINHRLLDYDGQLLGATGVGLKLDTVRHIVEDYGHRFRHNVYFVDDSGTVMLYSQGGSSIDNIRDDPGMSGVAGQILQQERGSFEYRRHGETMLLTSRYIPQLHWHVLVEERESRIMQGIRHSLLTNTAVSFVVILLTIMIVAYTVNRFQRRLESMAVTDSLTGIGNRKLFDLHLERLLLRKRRDPAPFGVILFDIDRFKAINDRFGHLKGDDVLCRIAGMVQGQIREGDLVCRWGGEEIIIVAEDCDLEHAARLAEKIRLYVAGADLDDDCRVTISGGVTAYQHGDDEERLLARVDRALYRAKEAGRDRVVAV